MCIFTKLFSKPERRILEIFDFWEWFKENESAFSAVIKSGGDLQSAVFDPISKKLYQLKPRIFYLAGILKDGTIDLVFTPDGIIKSIPFVEELVAQAPAITGWHFTALKQATKEEDIGMRYAGYEMDDENLFFYSHDDSSKPDKISLVFVHKHLINNNRNTIINGITVYLDTLLGEINVVTQIDEWEFIGISSAEKELVPISKLRSYLDRRSREFVEKYDATFRMTELSNYHMMEFDLKSGMKVMGMMNSELLQWQDKPSHPWIMTIEINYPSRDESGMPDKDEMAMMEAFEEKLMLEITDRDGYLNIGRTTGNGERVIYFACKEFRKPILVFEKLHKHFKLKMEMKMVKDKYWESLEGFVMNQ